MITFEASVESVAVVVLGSISIVTGLVSQTHPLTRCGKDITAIVAFCSAGTGLIVSQFT